MDQQQGQTPEGKAQLMEAPKEESVGESGHVFDASKLHSFSGLTLSQINDLLTLGH